MQRLIFICFIFTLVACNGERNTQREIINGMEHAVVQNTSDEFLRPLIANYLNYYKDFKEDEMAPIYLYRCAVLYYRVRNHSEAAKHLETILRNHPETEILEDTYLTLAMIQASPQGRIARAESLYKEYVEKYPQGKGIAQANYFFRPEKEKLQDHIDNLLKEIAALPRGASPNESQLNQLMFAYANFVKSNPDNPLSATYCLQGARLAVRLEQHLIAIQFLEKIYQNYPEFTQYPEALMMLAVEYDTHITLYLHKNKVISSPLDDQITAKELQKMDVVAHGGKLYQEILKRFPDHEVAESAKSGLKNLGKKTNQVVEEFIRLQDSIKNSHQPS
ncbi:tetratricopeptide repeat protein [Aureispira anguillae]|uniref:Tetratricopeptide repeat protein n=1 Tax=Aureispira anguillae TaxID=2864201 RepID=A0A915YI51_9BACT|nr:tetratricopeptide repeat protein [Aureispira anguillae]BDS13618.1 tetratricopeptide repeat protein [Aureispira anguillae]